MDLRVRVLVDASVQQGTHQHTPELTSRVGALYSDVAWPGAGGGKWQASVSELTPAPSWWAAPAWSREGPSESCRATKRLGHF